MDAAVDQHGDAVGQREDGVHVVLDQQHAAAALQALQERDQALALLDAHAGHRLVEQQQARLAGQRHGDLELALLAVAERCRVGVRAGAEADGLEAALGGLAQLAILAHVAQEAERMAVVCLDGERHVVERAELAQHRGDLERTAEPQPHARIGRQMGDVAAGKADRAGVRGEIAGELADQGGLAGAVGPDQRVDLARPHVDGDVVGREQTAETLDQAVGGQQRLRHDASPAARRCHRARRGR